MKIELLYKEVLAMYDVRGIQAYIFKSNKGNLIIKLGTVIVVFIGSVISSQILWNLVDMFIALLALINIYAMFALRKDVIQEYEEYGK